MDKNRLVLLVTEKDKSILKKLKKETRNLDKRHTISNTILNLVEKNNSIGIELLVQLLKDNKITNGDINNFKELINLK